MGNLLDYNTWKYKDLIFAFHTDNMKERKTLVFRQKDETTRYLFYETYRNKEAFDYHQNTEHVNDYYKVMIDSLAEDPIKGFWEEVASI